MVFPLANLNKNEVRKLARDHGLVSADKEESQEICFVPKDYRQFLEKKVSRPQTRGRFVDSSGNDLGEHQGLMYYTIGQRKGLGISDSTPYYVVSLNEAKNEVVLGKADELYCSEVMVADVNWISIKPPQHPFSAKVKLRYSHQETLSTINPINDHQVRIILKQPQKSVAPGQAAVFYDQDVVLGGGWIVSTKPIENSFLENEMEVPA